ncbi:MAG: CcdB family protein [Spirochaetales bacterium]
MDLPQVERAFSGDYQRGWFASVRPASSSRPAVSRLNPTVMVDGKEFVVVFQELAAVPVSLPGPVVGSAKADRTGLIAAIDLLFTGF